MMNYKSWFMAIRPKTLFASAGPVILGLGLTLHEDIQLTYPVAIMTLCCALLLQVSTNLVNDYYDSKKGADGDERLGPKRVTASGLLKAKDVKLGFIFTFFVSFVFGLYLMQVGGLPIIIIGLTSIFFAWAYTGGPFPLAYFALGEIAALIFFGPVAVWGTIFLQTGTTSTLPIFIGLGPGFIAAAIMAINNLRDNVADKLVKKTTIAVLIGEIKARQFVLLLIIFSTLIPFLFAILTYRWNVILVCFLPLVFLKTWKNVLVGPIDSSLNDSLAQTGKYLFLYCLLFSIGLAI